MVVAQTNLCLIRPSRLTLVVPDANIHSFSRCHMCQISTYHDTDARATIANQVCPIRVGAQWVNNKYFTFIIVESHWAWAIAGFVRYYWKYWPTVALTCDRPSVNKGGDSEWRTSASMTSRRILTSSYMSDMNGYGLCCKRDNPPSHMTMMRLLVNHFPPTFHSCSNTYFVIHIVKWVDEAM